MANFDFLTSLVLNVTPFSTKDGKKNKHSWPSYQFCTSTKQCLVYPIATGVSHLVCIASKKLVVLLRHADILKSSNAEQMRQVTRSQRQCELAFILRIGLKILNVFHVDF